MLRVPLNVPRLDLVDEGSLGRDTTPKALPTPMAEFNLCHVSPTAVVGGLMDVSFICEPFRLSRIQCFRERGLGVRIAIVHHKADFLRMRRMLLNQCLDKMCPINLCPRCRDFGRALTNQWFKSKKNICGPIPVILRVLSQRFPRRRRERSTDFPSELG
jgi:hypothetical protein